MARTAKLFTVVMVVLSLVFIPAGPAFSKVGDVSAESMIGDVLVARPLGLVAFVTGSVFYIISYPFAAAGGNTDESLQKLVKDPANYTFTRRLGDF